MVIIVALLDISVKIHYLLIIVALLDISVKLHTSVISSIQLPVETPIQLAIHPNPTSDYLNFQLRTPKDIQTAHFRIVDANGRTVKEMESDLPKGTNIVPVHDWAGGVYFLQYLENGQVRHTERFVVS